MIGFKSGVLRRFFFGFTFCLIIPAMALPVWCQDFTANINEEVLNHRLTGKIYVSDSRYRTVLHPPGAKQEEQLSVIVDRQKGTTILLPPQSTTYEEIENFTPGAYMADLFQSIANLEKIAQKKKIGTETVSGYACEHYAYFDHDFKLADVWYAENLRSFPIKAHIVSGRENGSLKVKTSAGDTRVELSHIKIEPVDAALFTVPRGMTKTEPSREGKKAQPALLETVKGTAPWGRRMGKGGEIQVQMDPRRPVKIILENLAEKSICTYTPIPQGKSLDDVKPIQVVLTKKGQKRKVEFDQHKKTQWVFIRVDEGLLFATVQNEKDPFAFEKDIKIQEGYLTAKALQGLITDPERELTITVTGDNQDGPESEMTLICYRKQYEDPLVEKRMRVPNNKTEIWKFSRMTELKP